MNVAAMGRTTVACLVAVAMSACGGGATEGAATANGGAEQYAGPIASSDTARGQHVYDSICMACHVDGPSLEGIGREPARIRQQVREGAGEMPPVRVNRVSPEDLEAILAYMVTIGGAIGESAAPVTGGGDEPTPQPEPDGATGP